MQLTIGELVRFAENLRCSTSCWFDINPGALE